MLNNSFDRELWLYVCGYEERGGAFSFEQLICFESKVGCGANKGSSNVHNIYNSTYPRKVTVNKNSHAKLIVAKSIMERMTFT